MNIFLVRNESDWIAKLGDFGSSRDIQDTNSMLIRGTPEYFGPEYFPGDSSNEQDIWALGVTIYNMLTMGDYPFDVSKIGTQEYI